MKERVHKILPKIGIGSRRKVEKWILEMRLTLNKSPISLGTKISFNQIPLLRLDGKKLVNKKVLPSEKCRVLIYNKPEGELCARSEVEKTVFDRLPKIYNSRWISVGRLDLNSSGLLLFTTDGQLAHRLMHPKYQIPRTYLVKSLGCLSKEQEQNLLKGIEFKDGILKISSIERLSKNSANTWYKVSIKEGKNREIRRLFELYGFKVNRLIRISYGPIKLPRGLRKGNFKEASFEDINTLKNITSIC